MRNKYKYIINIFLFSVFLISFLSFFNFASAQDSTVSFVKTDIWYSKAKLIEGDKVKIYTAIYNPDSRELSGVVAFYDNSVLLGKKNFLVPGNGVRDVSIDWTVTLGGHSIFAKIEDTKFALSKGKYEQVVLINVETKKDTSIVYKKIIPDIDPKAVGEKIEDTVDSVVEPVNGVGSKILENTPDFISEPVSDSVNFLENFRIENKTLTDIKKEQAKQEVEFSKDDKEDGLEDTTKDNSYKSSISTPFAYAKLFLFTLLSYILSSKLLFYGLFVIVLASLVAAIWRKFF